MEYIWDEETNIYFYIFRCVLSPRSNSPNIDRNKGVYVEQRAAYGNYGYLETERQYFISTARQVYKLCTFLQALKLHERAGRRGRSERRPTLSIYDSAQAKLDLKNTQNLRYRAIGHVSRLRNNNDNHNSRWLVYLVQRLHRIPIAKKRPPTHPCHW